MGSAYEPGGGSTALLGASWPSPRVQQTTLGSVFKQDTRDAEKKQRQTTETIRGWKAVTREAKRSGRASFGGKEIKGGMGGGDMRAAFT